MAKTKESTRTNPKQATKPKEDKQVVDGIGLTFEEAMKQLANPEPPKEK